jgi:hypothetical protein
MKKIFNILGFLLYSSLVIGLVTFWIALSCGHTQGSTLIKFSEISLCFGIFIGVILLGVGVYDQILFPKRVRVRQYERKKINQNKLDDWN